LIEIQGCKVSQFIVGKDDIPLSDGPLALIQSTDNQLKLVCGTAAFSLDTKHPFYTNTHSQRIYVFSPFLSATEKSGFYVKALLPESVQEEGSAAAKQRDEFEGILIHRGFLKEGAEAMLGEAGSDLGDEVTAKKDQHISSTQGGDLGQFGNMTHTIADKAVEYSDAVAGYSAEFSKVVGNAAHTVGAKISNLVAAQTKDSQLLNDPKVTATADRVKQGATQVGASLGSVAAGLGAGLSNLYTSTTAAAQEVIQHNFGSDAAQLSTQAGQTTSNLGETAGNATMATSTMFHGGKAAEGAIQGDEVKIFDDAK